MPKMDAERIYEKVMNYLSKDKKIRLELKLERRSLDANAYMWALIGKLSKVLGIPTKEIYINLIQDIGVYEIIPIKNEHVKAWIEAWEHKGLGNVCIDMGTSKINGYENIRCYYGSSTYDNKQMAVLIDEVITECKLQGIETLSDDKLKKLKQEWR